MHDSQSVRKERIKVRMFATMIPMSFFSSRLRFLPAATFSIIFCGVALAFTALQFDATASKSVSRTDGAVTAWVSTRGGVIANPSHATGYGWDAPQYDADGGIDFLAASGVASPLSFALSETGLVSRAFIVADGSYAAFCSTLLDAPCPLRLFAEDEDETVHFATSSVLSSLALSIDFAPGTTYLAGPHLYEIRLDKPCPLNELHIGGNPATPAWNRNWNGSVGEVVFTAPTATETDAATIRSYLSKKWGIGRYRSGMTDELASLRALGIRTGGVYGSMLIMR